MNSKVLFDINQNEDEYTWKQLSCVYRPWQTALQKYGETIVDMFLLFTSFYSIYVDRTIRKKIIDFIDPYNSLFSERIGIVIKKINTEDYKIFDEAIENMINQGNPILIPVDLMLLHYNPMYLIEHRYKCMLIKGYDNKRGLYYILDNIHIDYGASTKLTDFVIKKQELYDMFCSACENIPVSKEIFSLEQMGNTKHNHIEILKHLSGLISNIVKKDDVSWLEYNMLELDWTKDRDYIVEIEKSLDFRYVFFDKLKKYICLVGEEKEKKKSLLIVSCLEELYNKRDVIRRMSLQTKKINMDEYRKIKVSEKEQLIRLADHLRNMDIFDEPKEDNEEAGLEQCRIVNNMAAKIQVRDGVVTITHEKEKKYDTWIMQDNAVQIYYPLKENGFLEAEFSMDTGIGEDTHTGIVIKGKDGKVYLFGIVRGEFVAVYCPQLGNDYAIFEKHNYCKHKNYNRFRANYRKNRIELYYYDHSQNIMQKCIELDNVVSDIGLFSKTWENLAHSVSIRNIVY